MRTRFKLLLLVAVTATASAAAAQESRDGGAAELANETLHFRWRFEGMAGGLVKLLRLFPSSGDGVLEVAPGGQGRLFSEFRATSQKTAAGEHWTYRAELDISRSRTLRVWDRLVFRGRDRERSQGLAAESAMDLLSGIQMLRQQPPTGVRREAIWSGGKVYPVVVEPRGTAVREVAGRRFELRHYYIHGVRETGEPFWKGRADVWLTDDARAVPVEVLFRGRHGRLRLTLVEPAGRLRLAEASVASASAAGV